MREGWEIRKLGDVCKLYQPKTISNKEFVEGGEYPVYGSNGIIGQYNQYNHAEREILISCRGTCGRVNVSKPFAWINGNAMVVHITRPDIGFDFLKYQLMGVDMSDVITGATIPQITRQSLTPIRIVIPPVQQQKMIVAEMDCLTGIIEKKKQQLEELDKLAQSIFYDMFGDPIANEKGWEQRRLEELISLGVITYHLDGNHGAFYPRSEEFVEKGVPYIGANCIEDGQANLRLAKYLSIERADTLRKGIAKDKDILFAHNATVGPVALLRTEEERVILSTSLTAFRCNQSKMAPFFLRAYMCSEWFVPQYKTIMKQSTRNQIPISQQRKMYFILPPFEIQNEFAQKVEAIEKQKELVKQSIVETETLFNSRMDYWFN